MTARNQARFLVTALGSLPLLSWRQAKGEFGMSGGVTGAQDLLLAETLGLAMARRAADILDRHREALASGDASAGNGRTLALPD